MPQSEGRIYITPSTTTGAPDQGISIHDVRACIGAGSTDLGTLCVHANINKWAKNKPFRYATNGGVTAAIRQSKCYGLGLRGLMMTLPNYLAYAKDNEAGKVWPYEKPTGGTSAPYRLSDFEDYYQNSQPTFKEPTFTAYPPDTQGVRTAVVDCKQPSPDDDSIKPQDLSVSSLGITGEKLRLGLLLYDMENDVVRLLTSSAKAFTDTDGVQYGSQIAFDWSDIPSSTYLFCLFIHAKAYESITNPTQSQINGYTSVLPIESGVFKHGFGRAASNTALWGYNYGKEWMIPQPLGDSEFYGLRPVGITETTNGISLGSSGYIELTPKSGTEVYDKNMKWEIILDLRRNGTVADGDYNIFHTWDTDGADVNIWVHIASNAITKFVYDDGSANPPTLTFSTPIKNAGGECNRIVFRNYSIQGQHGLYLYVYDRPASPSGDDPSESDQREFAPGFLPDKQPELIIGSSGVDGKQSLPSEVTLYGIEIRNVALLE